MALDGDSQALVAWSHENDRGLLLAADGDWAGAAAAFQEAADALAQDVPLRPATHEPLALVLGNLAHACFKAGRTDDAIQHAQRTCALRVALTGEDGMPVTRARMDLAVMLASRGRGEEAMALIQRAMAAIEHRVGEEDVRLAIVLENAARIALAVGSPSDAEPLLLRLHALLHAHRLSTSRADQLLTRVSELRDRHRILPRLPEPRSAVLTPAAPSATVAMLQRVAETLEHTHLTLDDLEPLDEPAAPPLSLLTPSDAAASATPEYAHATVAAPAPWERAPDGREGEASEPTSAGAAVVSATPRVSDLDRRPTLALPTPGVGVRAMETPARPSRAFIREEMQARRERAEREAAGNGAGNGAVDAASAPPKPSPQWPITVFMLVATAGGVGALWWYVLR